MSQKSGNTKQYAKPSIMKSKGCHTISPRRRRFHSQSTSLRFTMNKMA